MDENTIECCLYFIFGLSLKTQIFVFGPIILFPSFWELIR